MAWEDAGWEPRDKIYHCFGSGFPKSLNLGNGWGTALKPAVEEWWLFRKPISEANIAANVLRWGVGGLHIDGCRVEGCESTQRPNGRTAIWHDGGMKAGIGGSTQGRFPAHLIHDGSEEVVGLFPVSESRPVNPNNIGKSGSGKKLAMFGIGSVVQTGYYDKETSAARFFKACPDDDPEDAETRRLVYQSKASKADRDEGLEGFEVCDVHRYKAGLGGGLDPMASARNRNHHPTVKSTNLMRYLCRLITPPGGIVLDPFMGSGSTGEGAALEGFQFIGIEQDAEYLEIARARIAAAVARSEALSLEQRVAWLETQVQAQGAKLRKIEAQHQQMSLFG